MVLACLGPTTHYTTVRPWSWPVLQAQCHHSLHYIPPLVLACLAGPTTHYTTVRPWSWPVLLGPPLITVRPWSWPVLLVPPLISLHPPLVLACLVGPTTHYTISPLGPGLSCWPHHSLHYIPPWSWSVLLAPPLISRHPPLVLACLAATTTHYGTTSPGPWSVGSPPSYYTTLCLGPCCLAGYTLTVLHPSCGPCLPCWALAANYSTPSLGLCCLAGYTLAILHSSRGPYLPCFALAASYTASGPVLLAPQLTTLHPFWVLACLAGYTLTILHPSRGPCLPCWALAANYTTPYLGPCLSCWLHAHYTTTPPPPPPLVALICLAWPSPRPSGPVLLAPQLTTVHPLRVFACLAGYTLTILHPSRGPYLPCWALAANYTASGSALGPLLSIDDVPIT